MSSIFADQQLAIIAAAIAEPARSRMLCALMDKRARTSTELAIIAEVSTSTASAHLNRLKEQHLLSVVAQGKHRYYQLASPEVAVALEALMNIANVSISAFTPNTPARLRHARTCYDHMAGEIAVQLHDYLMAQQYLLPTLDDSSLYVLSESGQQALSQLGVQLVMPSKSRRRYACACLDWSERRPHLGGALGAAFLDFFVQHAWVVPDLDSRALSLSKKGERQFEKLLCQPQ